MFINAKCNKVEKNVPQHYMKINLGPLVIFDHYHRIILLSMDSKKYIL